MSAADRNVVVGAGNGINISSTVVSTPDKCQVVNSNIFSNSGLDIDLGDTIDRR